MRLPIKLSYAPMEARAVTEIPVGPDWQYEPKWDGFRCLAFRDGDQVMLQSKSGNPLGRYFPEIVTALAALKAERFVLDGELVIPVSQELSFEHLLMRIHPAASRVQKLAKETPARFLIFDLLVDDRGRALVDEPLARRRPQLEAFARKYLSRKKYFELSPKTDQPAVARQWLTEKALRLDGVIAKRIDLPYQSGERTGMQKIKRLRTADCVVGGFRYASKGGVVGSLLLGLYDKQGLLNHVGYTSSLNQAQKRSLTKQLESLIKPPGFTGAAPGGPSRWATERSAEWEPLKPQLVVEVQYDHFSEGRFRHGTKFLRWRPDKKQRDCTLDQVAR